MLSRNRHPEGPVAGFTVRKKRSLVPDLDKAETCMKKRLIVRGYYGNGNCGDEALLQSIFSFFSDEYRIGVSVNDPSGVTERLKKKSIFPYHQMDIVSWLNRGIMGSPDTVGMFLGGRGLGL